MKWAVLLLSVLSACATATRPRTDSAPVDLVWRGEVRIDQDLVLPRGSRLTLEPGTVVRFGFRDDDGDGWGDASLRVEGELRAMGTPDAPVLFTSASNRAEPGRWGELRVDFGVIDLRYAVIEGSTRGLHAHFSSGKITDCVFRRNVDGTRLGESTLSVEHCLFAEQTGKGFNARRCRATVRKNYFRSNRHGIFLFEADTGSVFEQNVFRNNETPFRLGDFFTGAIEAKENDWGPSLPQEVAADSEPGARLAATSAAVRGAGPRQWPFWAPAWRVSVGGYVDASPVLSDEGLYVASWSGLLTRIGLFDGKFLTSAQLPDVIDSAPALGPDALGVFSWDRTLHLLRRGDLRLLDSYQEEVSPADDHRQATPVFSGTSLFAATWAGFVRAYDTSKGVLLPLWTFRAGGPFRADLILARDKLLAPCQDGRLYAFDIRDGRLSWSFEAGAPLLSGATHDTRRVFLSDRGGILHALELESGKEAWSTNLRTQVWNAPALLAAGGLFQGDDQGRLSRVDPVTGRLDWSSVLDGGIRSRPALAGDRSIAVGTAAGTIFLLDIRTGREWDATSAAGPIFSSPLVADSRVVFGSRDGFVYAFDVRVNREDE